MTESLAAKGASISLMEMEMLKSKVFLGFHSFLANRSIDSVFTHNLSS